MPKLQQGRIAYVCNHTRDSKSNQPSCGKSGGEAFFDALEKELVIQNCSDVEVARIKCLGACHEGCTMLVYPDNILYGNLTPGNAGEIVRQHFKNDMPVSRLVIRSFPPLV